MRKIILHLDMDYFFAQIEERENPQFLGKPLVVGPDPKLKRGVVSTANYIAREYGIKSGMPVTKAFKLCPKAIFLPVNLKLYQETSKRIMGLIKKEFSQICPKSFLKKWEKVSLDEIYLDLSFLGTLKSAEKFGKRLKDLILKKEKLTCTVGISSNKLLAKIATEIAKPDGLKVIKEKEKNKILEQLKVESLPGIGKVTAQKLKNLGIERIKELKKLSEKKLISLFGKVGKNIYEKARGIDKREVFAEREIKSIGKEITFIRDTREAEFIFSSFDKIIRAVFSEIEAFEVFFRRISVICRFSNFETHLKSKTFPFFIKDKKTLEKEAKILLLKHLMGNSKPVRLIGLRISLFSKNLKFSD